MSAHAIVEEFDLKSMRILIMFESVIVLYARDAER